MKIRILAQKLTRALRLQCPIVIQNTPPRRHVIKLIGIGALLFFIIPFTFATHHTRCFFAQPFTTDCSLLLPAPQTTHPHPLFLTLSEAVLLSLEYNQSIESNELSLVTAKNSVTTSYYQFQPQFDIQGNAAYAKSLLPTYTLTGNINWNTVIGTQFAFNYQPNFVHFGGNSIAGNAGVTITQPLLKGFGMAFNEIGLNNSIDGNRQADLQFRQSVAAQIVTIVNDYFTLLNAQLGLQYAKQAEISATQQYNNAKLSVAAGILAPSELLQLHTGITSAQQAYLQSLNSFAQGKKQLLQDIGLPLNTPITIDGDMSHYVYKKFDINTAVNIASHDNPGYLSQIIGLNQSKRAIISAENTRKWQLNLVANLNVFNSTTTGTTIGTNISVPTAQPNNPPTATSLTLNLSIPLFAVDTRNALVDARVSLAQNQMNVGSTLQNLQTVVANQVVNINSLYAQIELAKQNVALSKLTLRNSQLQLTYGRIDAYQVTTQRNSLLSSQNTLIAAETSYLIAVASLQQTMGTLVSAYGIQLRY